MMDKHVVLQTVAKIGPGEDTNSKAVDDDSAFAEEEAEQTLKTSAASTDSSASDKRAAQEKTTKGTQDAASTQGDAQDANFQKFQIHLAEWHKMFDEEKTEILEPKFEQVCIPSSWCAPGRYQLNHGDQAAVGQTPAHQ